MDSVFVKPSGDIVQTMPGTVSQHLYDAAEVFRRHFKHRSGIEPLRRNVTLRVAGRFDDCQLELDKTYSR